jgi:hypothetical protein
LSDELAVLLAKKFIQRRDIKAVQFTSGKWAPDTKIKDIGSWGPVGFKMTHLRQHLAGSHTYGHYLLDNDNICRMFAFDLDLEKEKFDPETGERLVGWWSPMTPEGGIVPCDPREEWANRASNARPWLKAQMSILARKLIRNIQELTQLPCAAAYSGSKGIHVYGFTEPMPAAQVYAAAIYVLEASGDWELFRGKHFYRHKLRDPELGYPNFSLEVFPKQDSLEGKDLGNLMRLPLGRNQKSPDPCFFMDLNTPVGVLAPHNDPVTLLNSGNPFA